MANSTPSDYAESLAHPDAEGTFAPSNRDEGAIVVTAAEEKALEEASAQPRDNRSYSRIVWDLAWPAIALNVLQVINGLLDAKFVASLGPAALSAAGAAMNLTFLLMSLGFSLGAATTALVSRFYGANDYESMIKASRQAVTLSIVVGLILSGVVTLLSPLLVLFWVEREGDVYPELMRYLYPMLTGIPAVFIFSVLAASLRAIGDTKRPMYIFGGEIVLHIILNFLLIFPTREVRFFESSFIMPGAGMGIAGAGWAFTISAWLAAIVYFPVASHTALGACWRLQFLAWNWVVRIVKIAAPASIAALIRVSSLGLFMAALKYTAEGESVALGALRVGIAMESIAFMPAFGYMIAASALVGQSLGMRQPERAEKLAWSAASQAVIAMTVVSGLFFIFAHQLASFFVTDPRQLENAALYLRIIAITEPLFGAATVLTGAFQGAGDTIRPAAVSFLTQLCLRAPATWLFAVYLGGNSAAAWWTMSATQGINGLLMIWMFKQGKWKEKKI